MARNKGTSPPNGGTATLDPPADALGQPVADTNLRIEAPGEPEPFAVPELDATARPAVDVPLAPESGAEASYMSDEAVQQIADAERAAHERPKRDRSHRDRKGERERARQRKLGVTGEPAAPAVSQEQINAAATALGLGFQMGFKMAARARGDHWLLPDPEAQALGGAWANAMAPWLPKIGEYMPWATAIIVTYGVVAPRFERDAELKKLGAAQPLATEVA